MTCLQVLRWASDKGVSVCDERHTRFQRFIIMGCFFWEKNSLGGDDERGKIVEMCMFNFFRVIKHVSQIVVSGITLGELHNLTVVEYIADRGEASTILYGKHVVYASAATEDDVVVLMAETGLLVRPSCPSPVKVLVCTETSVPIDSSRFSNFVQFGDLCREAIKKDESTFQNGTYLMYAPGFLVETWQKIASKRKIHLSLFDRRNSVLADSGERSCTDFFLVMRPEEYFQILDLESDAGVSYTPKDVHSLYVE